LHADPVDGVFHVLGRRGAASLGRATSDNEHTVRSQLLEEGRLASCVGGAATVAPEHDGELGAVCVGGLVNGVGAQG